MALSLRDGGYEDGYSACPCVWGTSPGTLVEQLAASRGDLRGLRVLDAGCGEGKNAAYMNELGATVLATDVSGRAIANARATWGNRAGIEWRVAAIQALELEPRTFDIVVAYGLLHCLASEAEVRTILRTLQNATKPGGSFVMCAFNARHQDLRAHPGFEPTLLPHDWYVSAFTGWSIVEMSDRDLHETHPHNEIPHVHSLTRILATKSNGDFPST